MRTYTYLYMHIHIYIYIYIFVCLYTIHVMYRYIRVHIYIYIERERDRERDVYIYIYIHTCHCWFMADKHIPYIRRVVYASRASLLPLPCVSPGCSSVWSQPLQIIENVGGDKLAEDECPSQSQRGRRRRGRPGGGRPPAATNLLVL